MLSTKYVIDKTQTGLKGENIIWKTWTCAHPLFDSIPKILHERVIPNWDIRKIRGLFLRFESWYISLPSSAKQQREMTSPMYFGGRRIFFWN